MKTVPLVMATGVLVGMVEWGFWHYLTTREYRLVDMQTVVTWPEENDGWFNPRWDRSIGPQQWSIGERVYDLRDLMGRKI